jgi:hypothetical protein
MLVRLLYASRAIAPIQADLLATILRKSTQKNARVGITGLLCHDDGVFLQVLEGARDAVSALYHRIVQDPDHRDVTLLTYDEIAERRFAGWSMGEVNLARLNPALILRYSETTAFDPYAMSGPVALALLDELVETASVACA